MEYPKIKEAHVLFFIGTFQGLGIERVCRVIVENDSFHSASDDYKWRNLSCVKTF